MNILLVEDDAVLADGLLHTLSNSGNTLTVAATGEHAKVLLEAQVFDLVVLDLGLPDMDGLTLLQRIRKRKLQLPVLILTAREELDDRIKGLEAGADDYLTKPFQLRELEARIHALIRRCYGGFSSNIAIGRLLFDTQTGQVRGDDQPILLPAREHDVLEILLMQAGKVVCKERMAQRLAGDGGGIADNAIEVYVHRVRKRIEPYGVAIRTLRGLGYLLEAANDAQK